MIVSNDVNLLVFQYLRESGFNHAAFALKNEAGVETADGIPRGALIAALQKALLMMSLEYHLLDVFLS